MLFSLLIFSKIYFSVFMSFFVIAFKELLRIPLLKRSTNFIVSVAIPTGAPIAVSNEARKT